MEYTTTDSGELATLEIVPIDWQNQYDEKRRLQNSKQIYSNSIDQQIAVIDSIFSQALTMGVTVPSDNEVIDE